MTTTKTAYVTAAGAFLPGRPIHNHEIEDRLGLIHGHRSRLKDRILRSNGIEQRHYALDDEGRQTHLNEELAAAAVTSALARRRLGMEDVDLLATATTMPDLLVPGFASMVHGRLGGAPVETLSASGVCAAATAALLGAVRAVKSGDAERAVVVGSELASQRLRARCFEDIDGSDDGRDVRMFDAAFLRFMLSDGAGAFVVEDRPRRDGLSLRVDWVSLTSYADRFPTCMSLGCADPKAPAVGNTWLTAGAIGDADKKGLLVVRQDPKILLPGIDEAISLEVKALMESGKLRPDEVTWFLPHLSSFYFHDPLRDGLARIGAAIPTEKWFTNLKTRGNTGAASFFLLVEEALENGLFSPGDRILALVPESGRFTVSFAHFTCVAPDPA